uniref:CTP synthase n=1 Tax=Schistosoma mansoni TaxID=6183 RepID=A0A5K4F3N0_SCHMA
MDTVKYILVTGGVISGIGKGIISSSIGTILKAYGWNVTCIKIDPYLNIDAGTFSPFEHGEVYVLDDGSEVDLDLGNYERFLNITLNKDNNITTGKIYQKVIEKERRGDYLGKTVQVVPHITDAIIEWVTNVSRIPVDESGSNPEVCIIELGGTIGDIESMPYVEAFRQMLFRVGSVNFCCVHVSLVPQLQSVGEPKTKPTQASVRELRACGLHPDLLMCRCSSPLPSSVINKISLFSQVAVERVIVSLDVSDLYEVPLRLNDQNLCSILLEHFHLNPKLHIEYPILGKWKALTRQMELASEIVRIAIVGKYTKFSDAYLSLLKALRHAAIYTNLKLDLSLVCAEDLEENTRIVCPDAFHQAWLTLSSSDAVVVPGGFGQRGVDGKLAAIRFCRERGVPFLGLCLGLQCAVIEFSRNVLGWKDANSTEFDPNTTHPVIIEMPEHNPGIMGGTMRLGRRRTLLYLSEISKSYLQRTYKCSELICAHLDSQLKVSPECRANDSNTSSKTFCSDSIMHRLINAPYFDGRHRHRYEINPKYVDQLEESGLIVVGRDAEVGNRMEIIELLQPLHQFENDSNFENKCPTRHPFFVATQFHPEYTSRPTHPSIFFVGLVLAASKRLSAYVQNPFRLSPTQFVLDEDDKKDTVDILKISASRKLKDTVSHCSRESTSTCIMDPINSNKVTSSVNTDF